MGCEDIVDGSASRLKCDSRQCRMKKEVVAGDEMARIVEDGVFLRSGRGGSLGSCFFPPVAAAALLSDCGGGYSNGVGKGVEDGASRRRAAEKNFKRSLGARRLDDFG